MTAGRRFCTQILCLVVTISMPSCSTLHNATSSSSSAPFNHQFVSADGGFVMESDFKTPVSHISQSFERYRFLRGDPEMILYRTTPVHKADARSDAARYPFNPDVKTVPIDWWSELRIKCQQEYIPTLPTVYKDDNVRLFFFNQYSRESVVIHGELNGKLFSLSRDIKPRTNRFGTTYDFFVWNYGPEVDVEKPEWQEVWHLVNGMQDAILSRWKSDADKFMKVFEPNYDDMF